MQPLDYGRSLVIGKADWNEVRFWVESRTRIVDERDGSHEDYIQCGSCKSEDTFGAKGLFIADNYDFIPVFGPEWGVIYRRRGWLNPNYHSVQPTSEMWDGQRYHLVEGGEVEELASNDAVLDATREMAPIVAQTEIVNEQTGLRAIIECPVKTLNTRREDNMYQVDTGPVVLPDLSERRERHVDGFSLAFVAFNVPTFADFILEVPTPVLDGGNKGEELCKVYHFSKRVSFTATNRLFAIRD